MSNDSNTGNPTFRVKRSDNSNSGEDVLVHLEEGNDDSLAVETTTHGRLQHGANGTTTANRSDNMDDQEANEAAACFAELKQSSGAIKLIPNDVVGGSKSSLKDSSQEGGIEVSSQRPTSSVRWCPDPELGHPAEAPSKQYPTPRKISELTSTAYGDDEDNKSSTSGWTQFDQRHLSQDPKESDKTGNSDNNDNQEDGATAEQSHDNTGQGGKKFANAVSAFMRLRRQSQNTAATGGSGFGGATKMGRRGSTTTATANQRSMLQTQYDGASFSVKRDHRDELNIESLRRREYEKRPMPKWERRKLYFQKWFWRNATESDGNDGEGASVQKTSQIRVPPSDGANGFFKGISHAFHLAFHDLIVWQINTSYVNFFSFVLVWYLILVNLFALILYLAIEMEYNHGTPTECITSYEFVPDDPRADFHQNMEFAFELSWTTFSTVGYGAISPSGGHSGCYWIRYICAIEAFIGVIYFGFSGAIFFAKINRILSRAPVVFSSTLCIQYDTSHASHSSSDNPPQATANQPMPFPVLEFRIVNNKSNTKGWEILEAELKCMVSIDLQDDPTTTATSSGKINKSSREVSELFSIDLRADENNQIDVPVSKQTFHKLHLEAESHPYFKRVWYCRHILNHHSPLVRREVRREIRDTYGGRCWPHDKGTHIGIRSSLVQFNTIITTMNGTLNITSNGVFIEKRYRFEDICIGYKFSGLLYLSDSRTAKGEKKVKIDLDLVHDIVPQPGGGAEPLDKGSSGASGIFARRRSRHTRQHSGLKLHS